MGDGIEWMITVALWTASLPGAVGRIAAFETGPLLLVTAGIVVICLLKTPLRWCGAVLAVAGGVWAGVTPQPDVLISHDAQAIAVRGSDGRLAIMQGGRDNFAVREWPAADADARLPTDKTLSEGFRCDGAGCIGRLADGGLVALARVPSAFAEDCRVALVVASPRAAPPDCGALVVDRNVLRSNGAIALRQVGHQWEIKVARPSGMVRPWVRMAAPAEDATELPATIPRASARDATPRAEDLQPGD